MHYSCSYPVEIVNHWGSMAEAGIVEAGAGIAEAGAGIAEAEAGIAEIVVETAGS